MSERIGTYRLKYYVHARHAIRWEEGLGDEHGHSWEIMVEFQTSNQEMIVFDQIEKLLGKTFEKYTGVFLNDIPPFDTLNPTLENITMHFFELVSEKIEPLHAILDRIEVGESPTRYYCITRNVKG